MAILALASRGNKVKVIINNGANALYPDKSNISLSYSTSDNTISMDFTVGTGVYTYPKNPIASVTIAGIVITNQTNFETQIDALFVGNIDSNIATLAAVGVSGVTPDQTNFNGRGVQLIIDSTLFSGASAAIVITIQGKDAVSGKYYTILTSAPISAISTIQLSVYPGGLNTVNVATSQPLPKTWRVIYTVSGTSPSITATIGASVIV